MIRRRVLVWDAPTRLFHWLTVLLVATCYATVRLNRMGWHAWAGDALLGLVMFRLMWGVFGSDTARFTRFITSPVAGLRHLAQLRRRDPDTQVGHNAAGGWMVLLLLALLLGQSLTGLYTNNEVVDQGPLSEMVPAPIANLITWLHDKLLWNTLLVAIALHVLAILAYAVLKGHNLLAPMVTGRKRLPPDIPAPRIAPVVRAVVLMAIASTVASAVAIWL